MTLPKKKPDGPAKVRQDVSKLLNSPLSAAAFHELREDLASAGYLAKGRRKTFTLTEAGRTRALQYLGLAEFPRRVTWSTVIKEILFPRAAGLSAMAAKKLDNSEKLAAFLLKRKYGLDRNAGSTVNQVLEALVCRELGYPNESSFNGLLCAVLSRLVGAERLSKEKLVKQLPLFETKLTEANADTIRRMVVQNWLNSESIASSPPEERVEEPFDLDAFAATVQVLAAHSPPQDRFHDNKVFIAALWRASQGEPNFPRLTLGEYKQRLVEANARNLLRLSRADLVQAMDPHLVAESETTYLNATFHFVLLEDATS
jgi:hypothetical protein